MPSAFARLAHELSASPPASWLSHIRAWPRAMPVRPRLGLRLVCLLRLEVSRRRKAVGPCRHHAVRPSVPWLQSDDGQADWTFEVHASNDASAHRCGGMRDGHAGNHTTDCTANSLSICWSLQIRSFRSIMSAPSGRQVGKFATCAALRRTQHRPFNGGCPLTRRRQQPAPADDRTDGVHSFSNGEREGGHERVVSSSHTVDWQLTRGYERGCSLFESEG